MYNWCKYATSCSNLNFLVGMLLLCYNYIFLAVVICKKFLWEFDWLCTIFCFVHAQICDNGIYHINKELPIFECHSYMLSLYGFCFSFSFWYVCLLIVLSKFAWYRFFLRLRTIVLGVGVEVFTEFIYYT